MWNKNVSFGPLLSFENVYFWNALQSRVCFVSKHLQLELDSTLSQSWIEFWNWIWNFLFEIQCLTLTWINLSWLFKSTVQIWAQLNIRNLVKKYPVLQVRNWICLGQDSWFVMKSSRLCQVSLLWKFELNWTSGTLSRITLSSK